MFFTNNILKPVKLKYAKPGGCGFFIFYLFYFQKYGAFTLSHTA